MGAQQENQGLQGMNTTQLFDKLMDVLPAAMAMIEKMGIAEFTAKNRTSSAGATPEQAEAMKQAQGIKFVGHLLTQALGPARRECFEVIAAWNGTTPDAIARQSGAETAKQIKALFSNRDVMDFFKSLLQ